MAVKPASRSYRATFRRHRLLYCLPPLLAAAIAAALVATKGATYTSSASLWIDNPPPLGSSLNSAISDSSASPATAEQTVLTELLTTRRFVDAIADKSSLRSYLISHAGKSGPLSFLSSAAGPLETRIESAIGPNVTSSVPGPTVLLIQYSGPTAAVSQSVLTELVAQLQTASSSYSNVYGQSELAYYRDQAAAARQSAAAAEGQASSYVHSHPQASATNNPGYSALLSTSQAATSQLAQAKANINQALAALRTGANAPIVKVIDAPQLPSAVSSGKKKDLEGVVGGLVAGGVISFLLIVLLTPGPSLDLDDELRVSSVPVSRAPQLVQPSLTDDDIEGVALDEAELEPTPPG